MTTPDAISPDLKTVRRRLKLSRMLDTLPERLTLARQHKMPHQDLLLHVLSDEVARREAIACAGYRVTAKTGNHKVTVDAIALAVGSAVKAHADYFETCRRKRNAIDYTRSHVATLFLGYGLFKAGVIGNAGLLVYAAAVGFTPIISAPLRAGSSSLSCFGRADH